MGRLFRKYDSSKSTIITKKHWKKQSEMEKFDNSKMYRSGKGHGSASTYLCINPIKSLSKNREFAQ
jgi:hypothetical protein